MPPEQALQFGPYRLVGPHGPLWCDAQVVPLPPKALAVLWRLATQAGEVVTKEALLDAGWPGTVVSEGVLTACLHTLRRALGEDAQQPRYIATVHRLGYRFVAPVTAGAPVTLPAPPPAPPASPPLVVGREAELAQLHRCVAQVQQGRRQTILVTGEAGVGKTTLVDAFVHQLASTEALWLGRGQCIEHYGAGEAYLPLLEALGRGGRQPGGERLVSCLRQYAPTWLGHLPALCRPDERAAVSPALLGATPARMLRELAEALEALAAEHPVVLVLEDLHWSDPSTVEALAWLARRRDPARLLVLGTYRPVELILHDHPLKAVKQELTAHGLCVDLPLGGLSQPAVAAYVAERRGAPAGDDAVAAFVYQRTEGHPLFMVQVVDYLDRHHLLPGAAAPAADRSGVPAIEQVVPQGLQDLLEAQLGRLTATEQQVLEGGSVAGAEFVVASVAAGLSMAPDAVEAVCERLARRGQVLEDRGLVAWPDGTVSGCYGFRHTLYQEVVYQRLGAGHRARVHRRIGEREAAGYGARAGERAAALAMHFARGRDAPRAVPYLQQAAVNALTRCAYPEAIAHLTTAVELIHALPETPERLQHEIALQLMLAETQVGSQGFAAPPVGQAYTRAYELCAHGGDGAQHLRALAGLRLFYLMRAELPHALAAGQQLLAVAQRSQRAEFLMEAHRALGMVLYPLGDLTQARTHLEQGLALADAHWRRSPYQHDRRQFNGHDPRVLCRSYVALTLWFLGYPRQAAQRVHEGLTLARELGHPFSVAHALSVGASLSSLRRESPVVRAQAEAAMAMAREHGFPFFASWAQMLQGWALSEQGDVAEGIAQLREGLAAYRAIDAALGCPYFLGLLAQACGRAGQTAQGLAVVDEALTTAHHSGERHYEAELYRLQGELVLQVAGRDRARSASATTEAGHCFRQALDIARRQQAKVLELRAAMSLARLWQQQGKRYDARDLLAPIHGWFTEGFDTADLQEAKVLLEELSSG
jgi:predicted ATPase/DNA-binding winged helix-turn-helix (wHTH) protein